MRIADDRRRGRGAEAAMLDDAADRVARLVGRREGDEQRVVAQRPVRLGGRARRAGTPGRCRSCRPSGCRRAAASSRPRCRAVDDRGHRLADESRDAPGSTSRSADRLALAGHQQPRLEQLPGCQPRRHDRQLHRVDQHIALADRRVGGVIALPLRGDISSSAIRARHRAEALASGSAGRTPRRSRDS